MNAPIAFSAIWGALRLGLPQRVLDKVTWGGRQGGRGHWVQELGHIDICMPANADRCPDLTLTLISMCGPTPMLECVQINVISGDALTALKEEVDEGTKISQIRSSLDPGLGFDGSSG